MGTNLITIVAETAAEALAEIHRQLGPNAIVVNVRKTAAPGISGIWKKGKIEVQATLPGLPKPELKPPTKRPSKGPSTAKTAPAADEPQRTKPLMSDYSLAAARHRAAARIAADPSLPVPEPRRSDVNGAATIPPGNGRLELGRMLENLGILPLHAQALVDQVRAMSSEHPPKDLREEFQLVQQALLEYWERLATKSRVTAHGAKVFVGAPGVGKTTCLCKWLTQEVLLKNQPARVWRLDTHTANTAEFLSIHGEILGVPVERILNGEAAEEKDEMQFVDVPGIMSEDTSAVEALGNQLLVFRNPQIFLVLNAAYELGHLLAQTRGFSGLPLTGIILTHLDEDSRWSKFWNLLMGTKLPILFLSGGQNIPGQFLPASPQSLFDVLPEQQP